MRPIERVYVYSLGGAEAFAAEMAGVGPIPADVRVAAQDAAAARVILSNGPALGLGTVVEL